MWSAVSDHRRGRVDSPAGNTSNATFDPPARRHKTGGRGAGLRTETTINNTYDFGVGRLLKTFPRCVAIGFGVNRRMLEVQTVSHDSRVGAHAFERLQTPAQIEGQRASALRFGDARVQALFAVLLLLCLQVEGFRNRHLRPLLAQMLAVEETKIKQGRVSYELRRLRLHGLIERIEKTHRYRLTVQGLRTVVFYQRTYARLLRPGLSILMTNHPITTHASTSHSINFKQKSMLILAYKPHEKLDSHNRLRRFKDSRNHLLHLRRAEEWRAEAV